MADNTSSSDKTMADHTYTSYSDSAPIISNDELSQDGDLRPYKSEPHEQSDTTSACHDTMSAACTKLSLTPIPICVAALLYFIPRGMNGVTLDSILYNKLCYMKYHNISLCSNSTFSKSHTDIQEDQATWSIYIQLAEIPLAVLMTLLLSSYCDKVGHKLPLVLPTVGSALASLVLALLATPSFLGLPLATCFIYSVAYSAFGGAAMVTMAGYSYISIISPDEKRGLMIALFGGAMLIGTLIGTSLCGVISDNFGLDANAYVSAGVSVLPCIVTVFGISQSKSNSQDGAASPRWKWRDALGFQNLSSAFRCIVRPRPGRGRILLILTFVINAGPLLAITGFGATTFLYLVKHRGWTLTQYSLYNSVHEAVAGVGTAVILYSSWKYFKLDFFNLMIGGCASGVLGYILMSIPMIPANFYISSALNVGVSTVNVLVKVLQIRLCGKDEYARLFAFDAIYNILTVNSVTIAFKSLYSATLPVWPEAFLALNALVILITMIVVCFHAVINDHHVYLLKKIETETEA